MQEAMDLEGGRERFIFRLLDLVEAELKESGDRQDEWYIAVFFSSIYKMSFHNIKIILEKKGWRLTLFSPFLVLEIW